ncbi:MAG: PAS domain-containing protein [Erythrobacter sp.]|nr:MAG: PAS domain-containing protein [Erythrobacter sp.]
MDTDLVLVWMNEAYLAATMRSREDIIGRRMFDAFPSEGESHRLLVNSLEKVLQSGEADEIALIRYDIAAPDGTSQTHYWSATHTPIHEDGALRYILQHTVDVTELEEWRQSRDGMGLIRRARSVQDENQSLKSETKRLLEYFDQAPGFTAVLVGPEHRFGMVNQAYRALVGRDDLVGRTVFETLPEIVEQGFVATLDEVYVSGQAYHAHREEVLLGGEGEEAPRARYLNFIFQPIFDGEKEPLGIIVQGNDVTEEVLALERQSLLVNELNHRVKNTLSIVQGLAMQSFRGSESEAGRHVFEARLKTLAAAHNLLTEGFWGEAEVRDIVRQSAEAAAGDAVSRMEFGGDLVRLPPQTSVSLAMIVHELCTNAIKYGALSNATGSVRIWWETEGEDGRDLVFHWKESGGPEVTPPARAGFGTRLITRGIGDRATGTARMEFEPDGLLFSMRARVEKE